MIYGFSIKFPLNLAFEHELFYNIYYLPSAGQFYPHTRSTSYVPLVYWSQQTYLSMVQVSHPGPKIMLNLFHKSLAPLSTWIQILDFNIMFFILNTMC
jgi:hypothetical protein